MQIEVVARDAVARRARIHLGEREVETPLVLYADTPRAPAPAFAEAVLSEAKPAGTRGLWVQDLGSLFHPRERDPQAALAIAPDLAYPPAAGAELAAAGEAEALQSRRPGDALVALAPQGTLPGDAHVICMGSARTLLENPYRFPRRIAELRARAGPNRLLYAPGCGLPQELALLAYAGVDVVDSTPVVLASRRGEYLTPEGPVPARSAAALRPLPCACPSCAKGDLEFEGLLTHNLHATGEEVARVRLAIETGRLRELVEARIRARPHLAANLRRLDLEQYDFFEQHAPLHRGGRLYATSKESLQRPEVRRWHRRLESRYEKPESARVLLALPCSARKPYSRSRTHRVLSRALETVPNLASVHEVVLTSPLGAVPREMENAYPAAHYDLPVTGHWDEDEKQMIREAFTALLARSRYDHVVVHLEEVETEILTSVLPDFTCTAEGDPLSPRSLENLRALLTKLTADAPRVPWPRRALDDMAAVARWQFGEAGRALTEGAEARGKWPYVKVRDPATKEQLAMLVGERGLLSLALAGGQRLLDAHAYRVEIEDFKPKGTLFGVGVVAADPEIRPGDDVVVHHDGELRAVGRALVSGREMGPMDRGGCVSVRRYVGGKGGGSD